MIPYTLAKEMKENGYPMRRTCECVQDICVHQNYPTLEEVIEALGDKFWALYNNGDGAIASHAWMAQDPENQLTRYGPTPLIAACNLWLAIQKQ